MTVERSLSTLSQSEGFRIIGDQPGDRLGASVAIAGDFNGDGFDDIVIGASGSSTNGSYSGASYVVFGGPGSSSDIDLSSFGPSIGFRIKGAAARDYAGSAVASAGDVNGDGFDDIIVGAWGTDRVYVGPYDLISTTSDNGAAYVIYGKASGFGEIDLATLSAADGFKLTGAAADDQAGRNVASAGDINDDGFDDILVAAASNDAGGTNAGAAYVIFGKSTGLTDVDLASISSGSGFTIIGDAASDVAGTSVSTAGDFNGDGIADIIVGAFRNNAGGGSAGAAYVIFGKTTPFTTIDLSSVAPVDGFRIVGGASDGAGGGVSTMGDINGDGFDDIVVGEILNSTHSTFSGVAYVIFGHSGLGAEVSLPNLSLESGFRIVGQGHFDQVGSVVSAAGDVNGDGFDDFIIGVPNETTSAGMYAGTAYLVYGKASGFKTIELSEFADSDGFKITGASAGDYAGTDVSGAGDLNGDGLDDLLVSAAGSDLGGVAAGTAYVIYGWLPDESVNRVGSAIGQTIYGGTFDDTLNGQGGDDTLIAAGGNDILIGGTGNDRLDGGSGGDTLIGGAGDDVYIADSANDIIVERAAEGVDTVTSSVSWKLGSGLENLTLNGSAAINGVGNNLANVIIGNAAANLLNGSGGADTMTGGEGDDTYSVDNPGDQVIEASALGGADKINSSVSFTLGANVEKLTLTGSAAIVGKGNSLANTIAGNGADNVLRGLDDNDTLNGNAGSDQLYGGLGTDKLTGGAGADKFVFDSALGGINHDNITDFSVADDSIVLDRSVFTAFAANGTLASSAFFTGSAAHDADDRIIYNSGNGNIYYDADGNGVAAQLLIAHVAAGLVLTNADFLIVS